MYRLIIIGILCWRVSAQAQQTMNSALVEDSTYNLYRTQNWKQLVKTGKSLTHQHYDYYYLRMRMAVANYALHRYGSAAAQLAKAEKFNSGDNYLQEYTFYALLLNNRFNEAMRYSRHFNQELRKSTNTIKLPFINMFALESGMKFSSRNDLVKPLFYVSLGLNHRIGRGFSLYYQYTYLGLGHNYGSSAQHQYSLQADLPMGAGFSLRPAIHYLNTRYKSSEIIDYTTNTSAFVASVQVQKYMPYVRLSLINSCSNFDNSYQLQHELDVTIFPLDNPRWSLLLNTTLFTGDIYKSLHPVMTAGFSLNYPQFFALSTAYTYAGVYNFNMYNGFQVQNGYDLLLHNIMVMPEFTIKHKYSIYGVYQLDRKQERVNGVNYWANGFSIGTKIKF